jgi:HEAT repeat protein
LFVAAGVLLASSSSYLNVAFAQRTDTAAQRKFDEARGYITTGEWAKAETAFINFIDTNPRSKSLDAALYWLAFSMRNQVKLRQAEQVLNRLAQDFPQSAWLDDARTMRLEIAAMAGNSQMIGEAAQSSSNDEAKIVALQTLTRQEPERAFSILMDILKPNSNASKGVKEAAINLLAQSGAGQSAPLLAQIARDRTDPELRKGAIRALGRVGGDNELALLMDLVRREESSEAGEAAIFGLAQHKSAQALEFLAQLATTTQSVETRNRIIRWLGTRDGSEGLEALSRIYIAVPDFEARRQIVISMFRNADRSPAGAARARLLEVARSANNVELRQEAINWLSRLRDERAIEDLSQLYSEEQNASIKEFIIGALGRTFGHTEAQRARAESKLKEIAEGDASEVLRARAAASLRRSQSGGGGPVSGFPGSLSGNAKGPGGALNLPAPQAAAAATLPKHGFIEITGNSFKDRQETAAKRGRAGTESKRFWLAYSFSVRPGRAYRARVVDPASSSGGTTSFDGPVPPGSAFETRNLAVFRLFRADTGALEEVALINLDRDQQFGGFPVYWLGRADTGESLNLLQQIVGSDQSGELSQLAISAIAHHNPSSGQDQAIAILSNIANQNKVEASRVFARKWLQQLQDERAR